MKISTLVILTSLFVFTGYSSLISAHTLPGVVGKKKSKAPATDQYTVTCFNDGAGEPSRLFVHVRDERPRNPALITIQAFNHVSQTTSPLSTDPVDGDAGYSPDAVIGTGAGPYFVTVNKSRSKKIGAEIYTVEFHCQTASGEHTGTNEPEMIQN